MMILNEVQMRLGLQGASSNKLKLQENENTN